MDVKKTSVAEEAAVPEAAQPRKTEMPRGVIAEWTVTIILLLFGTTTLVQAFVIPTGSMEDTLLIGDHLLVDKLAYAPPGPITKHLLPYEPVKRGDIIVFRYPVDIRQTFVKRVIGVPGDHIRLENKAVWLNGHKLTEPYKYNKTDYFDSYRDNFPGDPNTHICGIGAGDAFDQRAERRGGGAAGSLFRHGRQSRFLARQPLLGLRAAREHHRQAVDYLLVVRRAHRRPGESDDLLSIIWSTWRRTSSPRRAGARTLNLIHGYPIQ